MGINDLLSNNSHATCHTSSESSVVSFFNSSNMEVPVLIILLTISGLIYAYPQQKTGIVSTWTASNNNDQDSYFMRQSRPNYYYPQQPQKPQYPYHRPQYPSQYPPQYPPRPGMGCAASYACSSACQPSYRNYYHPRPYYQPQPPKPDEVKDSSTSRPPYIPQPQPSGGCQYSNCNVGGGYYGPSCGLRPQYNYGGMCGMTGGWPNSYCGNSQQWNPTPYCDNNLCTSDCQILGQEGGYCDQERCFCWRQNQAAAETPTSSGSEGAEDESTP